MTIEATGQRNFFSSKSLAKLNRAIQAFDWPVAFQLEALLSNGLLHTEDIDAILPHLRALRKLSSSTYVGDLLRLYSAALDPRLKSGTQFPLFYHDHTAEQISEQSLRSLPGHFLCRHVTFTPTRLILEGPYATQSNRIFMQFAGYEDRFLCVGFRDEDRLKYSTVDGGATLVRQHVGSTLKEGFSLGGREFEFLAYSSSSLREHAVWFISPFDHPIHGLVNAQSIRNGIGDFTGREVMKQPSKWATLIAQSFTPTNPSVRLRKDEWEQIDDIGLKPHVHTDGAGTISQSLASDLWSVLRKERQDFGVCSVEPSAVNRLPPPFPFNTDDSLGSLKYVFLASTALLRLIATWTSTLTGFVCAYVRACENLMSRSKMMQN